jgi:hypothetical protein
LGKQGKFRCDKNSAAVVVNTVGNGRVINIADNPNFRAFWLGGSKLYECDFLWENLMRQVEKDRVIPRLPRD